MPRRGASQASESTRKAKDSRWRYLLRNPEFRGELAAVSRLAALADHSQRRVRLFDERFEALLKKWGFSYLNLELLLMYHQLRRHPVHEIVTTLDSAGDYVLSFPVSADERGDDDFLLRLQVDLRHPLDVLMAHVEEELQDAIGDRPRQRRRLDKVDFYLDVFDRAVRGESFKSIARTQGRGVSTVKTAFLAAKRNIFGSAAGPSKKGLPLVNFDTDAHHRYCSVCKKANTFNEMCTQARTYFLQDHKGQRELTGFDSVRDTGELDR
jgi:hypothetical protein